MSPPDQQHRTRAWQCFDRNVDVTAGAGTGKTRVLVDRYLAWVLAEGWTRLDPGQASAAAVVGSILAITFTEKAAGEMQERIGRSLRVIAGEQSTGMSAFETGYVQRLAAEMAEHHGLALDMLRARARAALDQAHRMEVSTIHSFAAGVLRAYPIEAGIHPDFTVDVHGTERAKLLSRAFVETTRAGLLGDDADRYIELLTTFDRPVLEQLLARVLETGCDLERLAPPPDFAGLALRVAALRRSLQAVSDGVKGNSRGKFERVLHGLGVLGALVGDHADVLAETPRALLTDAHRQVLSRLYADLGSFPPKSVAGLLGSEMDAVAAGLGECRQVAKSLQEVDPAIFRQLHLAYGEMLMGVGAELRSKGLLSFDDLLALVERLLTGDTEVARALALRYGQLLVDEFQDTNPQQCAILHALAAAAPEHKRLFVVGDPKQSIYAFRNADLAAYERFTDGLEERLVLRASFRSQGRLVDAMNRGFDALFVPVKALQPGPQALAPTREPTPGPAIAVWDAGDPDGEKRNAEEAREVEAQAILRRILHLDRTTEAEPGQRWSRFAVLCRVQSRVTVVVDALEAAGIPCIVTGDKEFYRRQEVLDTVNLLRVILDPADGVAWVGLLRSPLGGLPDRYLLPLARAGFFTGTHPRQSLAKARAVAVGRAGEDSAPARHFERLRRLVDALESLRRSLYDGPIDVWLDELLRELPIPELHATQYLGERKAANVMRVLHSFCQAAVDGTPLREWLDDVAERLEGRADESESALADDTTDAVRLMSIHASKGLQFEHVFVTRLDWVPSTGERDDVVVLDGPEGWVLRAVNARSGVPAHATWGLGPLRDAASRVDDAEALRLLYVACTRARESLTLMGMLSKSRGTFASLVQRGFTPIADEPDALVQTEWAEEVHPECEDLADAATTESDAMPAGAPLVGPALRWWAEREAACQTVSARPLTVAASGAEPDLDEGPVDLDFDGDAGPGFGELSLGGQGDLFQAPSEDARELGVSVHAALEWWDPSGDPDGAIAMEGLSEPAAIVVRPFFGSPLATRVAAARRTFREMPFLTGGDPTEVGIIDLLLETDDGWVIVDYKTNRVADANHARHVAAQYERQARMYGRAVRRALGVDQVRFELWFLRGLHVVELDCRDEPDDGVEPPCA